MNTFIIIYIIFSIILFAFLIWTNYKLNIYIGTLEEELDEVSNECQNNKRVLEEAIKEDYLEKDKNLKVKKPRISKNEI